MIRYNCLLLRQLHKSKINLPEITDPGILKLLSLISESYDANDEEKELLERSFEISSREYQENLDRIRMLQTQLIHNEKLAGIGQLSAGIAHEINNPLGYVQSNLDTLKTYIDKIHRFYELGIDIHEYTDTNSSADLNEKCAELKAYIRDARIDFIFEDLNELAGETVDGLHRIEKIVKSLLGFTRKGFEEEFAQYDLNQGIRETLTIANNEIKYHVNVIQELENVPSINALEGEINQVLLNLILNAGYAIKDKGTSGTISIHTYADENHVYCDIADDGMGIPEDHIGRIFEPFYTTKPVGIGTGLGLSIAHDIIVNKHKGAIDVKSKPGNGTMFKLVLPHHPVNDDLSQDQVAVLE